MNTAHLALAHTVNMYSELLGGKDREIMQQKMQIKMQTEEITKLKEELAKHKESER